MSKKGHRKISDADWNQLITLASGYLALEDGDIQASMARALGAHVDLISALKAEAISADIPGGRVTMFVPLEGGVALRIQSPNEAKGNKAAAKGEASVKLEEQETQPPKLPIADEPTRPRDNHPTFLLDED